MPGPLFSTSILDNFDRANAATLGANWTADILNFAYGSFDIVTNTCARSTDFDSNWWNVSVFGADQEAYYTITTYPVGSETHLYVRLSNPGTNSVTGYFLKVYAGGDSAIFRRDNQSTEVQLGTNLGVSYVVNDRVGLSASGSSIEAWRDSGGGWTSLGTRTDSTYTGGGYVGLLTTNNSAFAADDFGGGGSAGSVGPTLRIIRSSQRW